MGRQTDRFPAADTSTLSFVWVTLLLGIVTFTGQWGRQLLTVDDFREVEVAREISQDGNLVVPHLAGLPFVEKPPGFPAVLAAAFRLVGHPSIRIARLVSAGFSALTIFAAFLLGRSMLGSVGGLTTGAFLSFSPLFLCTSHTILLDNALAAAVTFTLYFGWTAISREEPREKRWRYAVAGFTLGLAFLLKGLVGPALVGSGLLLFLGMSRRWAELKHVFHPLAILAFLLPVALWLIPFLHQATPDLVYEFLVLNHFGRFTVAYESHPRPPYFYAAMLGYLFAPGVLFLPSALWRVWKNRLRPDAQGELFGLAFSLGPLVLLSLSRAKDSPYLLPAFPGFALLATAEYLRSARPGPRAARIPGLLLAVVAVGAAALMIGATAFRCRLGPGLLVASIGVVGLATGLVRARGAGDARGAGLAMATLLTTAVVLFYGGPLTQVEVERKPWCGTVSELAAATRGRRLFLHAPDDILRGGLGFYREDTAREIRRPSELVSELTADSGAVALVPCTSPGLPAAFLDEAADRHVRLIEERRCRYRHDTWLVLISARPDDEAALRLTRPGS